VADPRAALDVARAYDRWAAAYDAEANRTRDLAAAVLHRTPLRLAGRRVVEVGCGTGANSAWLAERGAAVLGLDVSPAMLRRASARVRSPRACFVQHDVRAAWPVRDGAADVVIAMLVLEHVEDLSFVFAEAARVLRRGGEVLVCELHPARQLAGRQAEFSDPGTGETVRVPACLHEVSEYVNAGLAAGLALTHLGEWRDADAPRPALPRLLSLRFAARP
jgi:ubiquinone/menaquinone biosynthesis C-methylase UbiE